MAVFCKKAIGWSTVAAVMIAVWIANGRFVRAAGADASAPPAILGETHGIFLRNHCLKCHGAEAAEGIPRFDTLSFEVASVEHAERWQKVLAVLNSGEMPPPDEKQPDAAAKTEFLAALSQTLVAARKALGDQGRVGVLRRLNRREYSNTVRDLLGIEPEVEGLPADAGVGTFDTVGSALTMSSDQLERYLDVARAALASAFADVRQAEAPPEPTTVRREPEIDYQDTIGRYLRDVVPRRAAIRLWDERGKKPEELHQLGIDTKLVYESIKDVDWYRTGWDRDIPFLSMCLSLPRASQGSYLLTCAYPFHYPYRHMEPIVIPPTAPPGEYQLRASIGTSDDPATPRRFVELCYLEDGDNQKPRSLQVREVTNHFKTPAVIEFPVRLTPGSQRHYVLREKRYSHCDYQHFSHNRQRTSGNGMGDLPTIWIDWVEWQGPLPPHETLDRWVSLLGSSRPALADDAAARDVLARFATKAFRGVPPTRRYLDRLMSIRQRKLARAKDFLDSLVEPMAIVLASPGFLYLNEPVLEPPAGAAAGADRSLSATELATRLSYLMWAGPPDEQLLAAAQAGDLARPERLAAEIDRLAADPRSLRFATGFAHQWLSIDRLDFFQFDAKNFPEFDEATRAAAKQEVYATVHHLLRENLDARRLLHGDFVVINDLLAAYYRIDADGKPVKGQHFRAVRLPDDSPRGGLLGTACVLAMGSNGSSTSPVERGAWVLRKLLNDPPAPAPANVPQLSRLDGKKLTARERMLAHQEQPQCAQCHRQIDPIGFGLENFDAAGQWREVDSLQPGIFLDRDAEGKLLVETYRIDPSGAFFGGPAFANFFELRDLIAARGDDFLRGLVERLCEYALGRPVSFADGEAIDQIVAEAKARGAGFRDIVKLIVSSPEFLTK
jgi:hypothetical protein